MQQILSEALGAVDIGCILQVPEGWEVLRTKGMLLTQQAGSL